MKRAEGDRTGRRRGPGRIAAPDFDIAALVEPITVTSLSEVAGRTGRVRVALNGLEVGVLTLDYVADHSLGVRRTLSPDDVNHLVGAVGRTIVLDKALDLLAVRARSARDLGVRLRRAGADEAAITWAIDRLSAQGFVDDAAYARQVALAKLASGGMSRRKAVSVLRQRGIGADVADAAIEAVLTEVDLDEEGAALAAARKRLRSLVSLDPARRRQRLYAFLARRGYGSDVVRRILRQVLES